MINLTPAEEGTLAAAADDAQIEGMTHSNAADYIAAALAWEHDLEMNEAWLAADAYLCAAAERRQQRRNRRA